MWVENGVLTTGNYGRGPELIELSEVVLGKENQAIISDQTWRILVIKLWLQSESFWQSNCDFKGVESAELTA